ncbi:MAG: 4-methyl-5(b-hydroxyethyl)-thiazole monophosphate biosynthesis [Lentimonas sp.]|jgi:4-methyl-5(b-hydroxyethyl)-thiazole monophosphate biosynthesis
MKKKALIILHNDFEEIEAVTPIDLLSRAGIEVTQASIEDSLYVTGRSGITLEATDRFDNVIGEAYDAIILPGGPGIQQLRRHPAICELLRQQVARGKIVGCICAAPLLLLDAGLIEGLDYTAYPATIDELPQAKSDPVVVDGNIITSRGAGTAIEFGLALVKALTDKTTAKVVGDSIVWPRN